MSSWPESRQRTPRSQGSRANQSPSFSAPSLIETRQTVVYCLGHVSRKVPAGVVLLAR